MGVQQRKMCKFGSTWRYQAILALLQVLSLSDSGVSLVVSWSCSLELSRNQSEYDNLHRMSDMNESK